VGLLWTPGYWGWGGGVYAFHAGYWGPHVGFYGGVNYGFGFTGIGFQGGYWSGGHFAYNSAVNNVNTTIIHNTYNRTVINNTVVNNRVSFNGGPGGINARPGSQEQAAMREQHFQPTANQLSHEQAASTNRAQWASVNHGRPAMRAMSRPMPPPNSVNTRRVDQQDRIANGVRSGQLTPGETARIESHQQQINRQISQDRRASGGTLTPAERQNINRQQNTASRQIYREKHNEKEAPR
jgi:hypothetical protein